jgi:hypothetical protein
MPFVRPGMDRNAVGAALKRQFRKPLDTWPWQVSAVAQEGNGIDVDGQRRFQDFSSTLVGGG